MKERSLNIPVSAVAGLRLPKLTETGSQTCRTSTASLARSRSEVHNDPSGCHAESAINTPNLVDSERNSIAKRSDSVSHINFSGPDFQRSTLSTNVNDTVERKLELKRATMPAATQLPVDSTWSQPKTSTKVPATLSINRTTEEGCVAPNLLDCSQALAVVSVVESKRRCWLENELRASKNEWDYYLSKLDKATQETQQLETYLANSNVALVEYSQAIDDLCAGQFKAADGVDVSAYIDKESDNDMFNTLDNCYCALKESLESQLPEMTDSLRQASLLKKEVGTRAIELEQRGKALGWDDIVRVEATIQESFDSLLGILTEQGVAGTDLSRDRWLAETRYRNAARLGLDTWRAVRHIYQQIYSDFWKLEDFRKQKQKELLLSFLPIRQSLMKNTYYSFDAGADVVAGEPSKNGSKMLDLGPVRSSGSAWDSCFLSNHRSVQLKVGREWKPATAATTKDRKLNIFLSNVGNRANADVGDLLYVAADLTEYSIAQTGAIVEVQRNGRSKIFRKRQDQLTLRLNGADEAAEYCTCLAGQSN